MAKIVNLGDPLTDRMTLRLTAAQHDFIIAMGLVMGCSPSDYIRFLINQSILTCSGELNEAIEEIKGEKGGQSCENCKTCSDGLI